MEIPNNEPLLKRVFKYSLVIISVCVLFLVIYFSVGELSSPLRKTSKPSVAIAEFKGLEVITKAFGHLRPSRQSLLISSAKGLVTTIHVKPGVRVKKGDAILTLSNVELVEKLTQQELAVLESNAELKKHESNLNKEMRTLKNELALLDGELAIAAIEQEAKKKLFDRSIISALEYKKSQLQYQQGKLNQKLSRDNLDSFVEEKESYLSSALLKLKRSKLSLAYTQASLDNLIIKAPFDGLFSNMSEIIELGAQVKAGEMLGAVSDPKSLYAELNISAIEAVNLRESQKVILSIKGEEVLGEVSRIEPTVNDNQVTFDVIPKTAMPKIARPNIEVSGKVIISLLATGVVVSRPDTVFMSNQTYDLFVNKKHENSFVLTQVTIGETTKKQMQVISGMVEGDSLLVDVPNHFKDVNEILIESLNE